MNTLAQHHAKVLLADLNIIANNSAPDYFAYFFSVIWCQVPIGYELTPEKALEISACITISSTSQLILANDFKSAFNYVSDELQRGLATYTQQFESDDSTPSIDIFHLTMIDATATVQNYQKGNPHAAKLKTTIYTKDLIGNAGTKWN